MKYPKIMILLGLLLFVITACQPQEGKLPFETIAQDDGGWGYMEEKPNLLIITDPAEVANSELDIHIPSGLADELRQLDYDRFFAILVLQGQKRSTGYAVSIKRIVRQRNQVTIDAEFVAPSPSTFRKPAFTSPYHLVAVSKERQWGQEVKFVLVVNGATVAETTHFIP